MTVATVLFVTAVLLLLAVIRYGFTMMGDRTDQLYEQVMLSDAEWTVTSEDRAMLEAAAVTEASAGWDMPDYAEHERAAKATVEAYDLEREMLSDLSEAITVVEDKGTP